MKRTFRRRGVFLMEVMASIAILTIALATVTALVAAAAKQRRIVEDRRVALQQAENLLARLSAEPFEALSPARAEAIRQASAAGPALQVALFEETGPPAKRIVVRWLASSSRRPSHPAQLTAWVYP